LEVIGDTIGTARSTKATGSGDHYGSPQP